MICKIPDAKNYGQAGPCIMLVSHEDTCYEFEEVPDPEESLTLSYSLAMDNWAYFHDYAPQAYLRNRNDCFVIDQERVAKLNTGAPRTYATTQKPYLIDLVFASGEEIYLDEVLWNTVNPTDPMDTFTHITASNEMHTTGRKAITARRIAGLYSYNEFRNIATALGFRLGVFDDYNIDPLKINTDLAFYEKERLIDNYAVIRLEYNGVNNITFIGATVGAIESIR